MKRFSAEQAARRQVALVELDRAMDALNPDSFESVLRFRQANDAAAVACNPGVLDIRAGRVEHVRTVPVKPKGKSHPKGAIPAGPWYALAWKQLSDADRVRLTGYTRMGAHYPVTVDSPVVALGSPSKMPGYSWSMTAGKSCPGAVFGTGSICGACYAGGAAHRATASNAERHLASGRGYLRRPAVKRAGLVRFAYAQLSMGTDALRDAFIATMVEWLQANVRPAEPYFRIHDSGDFFSPRYVVAWAMIVARTPGIRYWAPTRSHSQPAFETPAWRAAFARLVALPNMTLRPSAFYVNDAAPMLPGYAAGSGVAATGWNCPASTQGNACQDCRQCWDAPAEPITYHLH